MSFHFYEDQYDFQCVNISQMCKNTEKASKYFIDGINGVEIEKDLIIRHEWNDDFIISLDLFIKNQFYDTNNDVHVEVHCIFKFLSKMMKCLPCTFKNISRCGIATREIRKNLHELPIGFIEFFNEHNMLTVDSFIV